MSIQQSIDNVPLGWKRFCLQYLYDKDDWQVEYAGKGKWTLKEPDTGGWWIVHEMKSVHDWKSPQFIRKMGWEIAKKDVVTPMLEELMSALQEMAHETNSV